MVTPTALDRDGGRTPARAQLVLVGSIAIAVVLIGLTVILNSAVFTENVAGGSSVEVTGDIAEFDREAVRNVRSLALRVNHGTAYTSESAVAADVDENVSHYSHLLGESYADTGSVYVNVSLEDVDEYGDRMVQRQDSNFSDDDPPSPPPTWTAIDGPFELGWLVTNFDVENVSRTDTFYVSLTNTTGTELNVSVSRDSNNRLLVNSSVGGSHVSNVTCDPQNGRVLLDVAGGTSYTGDCTFNSTGYLDPPYDRLRFVNGDAVQGKYDVVVNESSSTGVGNACNVAAVSFPCISDVVWSVNVTTSYQTGSIEYEHTHEVDVYDP